MAIGYGRGVGRAEGTWGSYLAYRSRWLPAFCLALALALLTLTVPMQGREGAEAVQGHRP